jgi:hypothetical protein
MILVVHAERALALRLLDFGTAVGCFLHRYETYLPKAHI